MVMNNISTFLTDRFRDRDVMVGTVVTAIQTSYWYYRTTVGLTIDVGDEEQPDLSKIDILTNYMQKLPRVTE